MPQINTNLNIEISYDSWLGILFWGVQFTFYQIQISLKPNHFCPGLQC